MKFRALVYDALTKHWREDLIVGQTRFGWVNHHNEILSAQWVMFDPSEKLRAYRDLPHVSH